MPTSLIPPPADNEVECANCGAYIYIELTHCPNCGVNLYEPEEAGETRPKFQPRSKFARVIESIARKFRGKPDPADELFIGALREKALFDNLLRKVGGDRTAVDRLIEFERTKDPAATRFSCLQTAIHHWEQENR